MVVLILAMLCICIGAVLGARFKILILVPAIGLGCAAVLAAGIARGDGAMAILVAVVVASSGLQIGYLCGVLMQHAGGPAHADPSQQPQSRQ